VFDAVVNLLAGSHEMVLEILCYQRRRMDPLGVDMWTPYVIACFEV